MTGPRRLRRSRSLTLLVACVLGACALSAQPAFAHHHFYGGRAKHYRIGTPTGSGAHRCAHGLYSGPRTGCVLARHVFRVFARGEHKLGHAPGYVRARGHRRSRLRRFKCEIVTNGPNFVVCYGKSGELVDFPTRRARR